MKKVALVLFCLVVFTTSCIVAEPVSSVPPSSSGYHMGEEFSSYNDFLRAIALSTIPEKDTFDSYRLKSENKIFAPVDMPHAADLKRIILKKESIGYLYECDDKEAFDQEVMFVWLREYSPKVLLSSFPHNEAIRSWKFDRDSITYYVEELPLLINNQGTGINVRFVMDSNCFMLNLPPHATEDDIVMASQVKDVRDERDMEQYIAEILVSPIAEKCFAYLMAAINLESTAL